MADWCAHCRGELRGFASVSEWKVCHPDSGLDCYRLVTVYKHGLHCRTCVDVRILEDEERRERMWGKPLQMGLPNMTTTEATRFND